MDYYSKHDNDDGKGPDLLRVCRRFRDVAGAIISQYAAQIYYPAKGDDPFSLITMTSAGGKPEDVRSLIVHLVWDGTFRAESLQEWRQSFFALAQQMNKLPGSEMVNLRYIQIRLQPAPIGEICQGPLSSFKKVLEHSTLKLIDIMGSPKDYKHQEAMQIRLLSGHFASMSMKEMGSLTKDDTVNGLVGMPCKAPKKELIVAIKRHATINNMVAAADGLTAISDKLRDSVIKSWYMKMMDKQSRPWGFYFVQDHKVYLKWQAHRLEELESEERRAAEEAEDVASDAATEGSSSGPVDDDEDIYN
ncbi:hypothetical protein PG996_011051 [Apiospora saccharicola]|uniref:Uncharacterized protein n=1 Tax=Apiospora saccharicola TaxID=335842 RepID=A0ABR1UDZ3_9PEZI